MITTVGPDRPCASPTASMLRSVDLAGPSGRLEAVVNEGAPGAPFAALVCHPHPLGGGSMHNKVVYQVMKVLNDPAWGFGWPTLRFNFRGVGLSQGVHDGQAESEDVLAALAWLENAYRRPLIVSGFSFGAAMAVKALAEIPGSQEVHSPVRALIALGLPTVADGDEFHYPSLAGCTVPKLFLSGDHDRFAPAAQLARVVASAAEPKRLLLLPGGDHFFAGQLELMQEELAGWLKEQVA